MRRVLDPPVSAFSLSLYRHPFLYTLFSSRFTLIINNKISIHNKQKQEEGKRYGGALVRASAFRVGLGVSGADIVSGSSACPSHLWMSRVLTSSSSLGSSSLFCRGTQ